MNHQKSVQLYIMLKHLGNIRKKIKEYPFLLNNTPHTLRELIEESVISCVDSYHERVSNSKNPSPLTDEQLEGMREIGKFAFDVHYNEQTIDKTKAIQTAIDAVSDGLVRVFKGTEEIVDLDGEIDVTDGDIFTFVRLTMLSGRMW